MTVEFLNSLTAVTDTAQTEIWYLLTNAVELHKLNFISLNPH